MRIFGRGLFVPAHGPCRCLVSIGRAWRRRYDFEFDCSRTSFGVRRLHETQEKPLSQAPVGDTQALGRPGP